MLRFQRHGSTGAVQISLWRKFQSDRTLSILFAWVVAWTVIFSGIDFWTIKLNHVDEWDGFHDYRAVMRYGASWASPLSFALAENTYFVWMDLFDPRRTMHEWDWYSGNPLNPDGYWNFVWGGEHGWVRFSMWKWYVLWLIPTVPWLIGVRFIMHRLLGRCQPTHRLVLPLTTGVAPTVSTSQENQARPLR